MKKLLVSFMLISFLVLSFACTKSTETGAKNDSKNDSKNVETKTKVESEYPFPSNAPEVGGKKLVVSTATGTTEEGNVPEELLATDTLVSQIGLDIGDMEDEALNWDGKLEIFVYVNDMFVQREQTAGLTQTSIDLKDWMLKPGIYTVTATQFENNDPTGKVVNLSQVKYKIKN